MKHPVFIVLNEKGATLAQKLAVHIPNSEVHGLKTRVSSVDVKFERTINHIQNLFSQGHAIIAIASSGIVIRALAPILADKTREPPVLSLSEDGRSVVPLLGGHRGANDLATIISSALNINSAITTAGDTRFGIMLDNPPEGWRIAGSDKAKSVMAALLNDESVNLKDETAVGVDKSWLLNAGLPFSEKSAQTIRLTHSCSLEHNNDLVILPSVLALGIGCERGVDFKDLRKFIYSVLEENRLSVAAIACIATIDLKEDETAIREMGSASDLPVRLFSAAELEREITRISKPSEHVFDAVGSHSVCEAAAFAAAGHDSTLIVPKQISNGITCAIALSPRIIEPMNVGRGCGRLAVVGIGPGSNDWRTPEATNEINRATDIVGYKLYLDLLGTLIENKNCHKYQLGEERARVAEALRLASEGKEVALISSGDAGIYGMACLVFELIEEGLSGDVRSEWQRVEIRVFPGISALQAAASRIGAPLGHDFCTISLSDLLTPWSSIEKRLKAATDGDFVIALYNPVSKKRRKQLGRARDILLQSRAPNTPVVLAKNLGRDQEKIDVINLNDLHVDLVDMLTLVLVGNTTTKRFRNAGGAESVYTPRGYTVEKKGIK